VNSIRARLLLSLLAMLAVTALVLGAVTYRNVRIQTASLFDYQLRQAALALRDQGEIAPDQASALADEDLDFVVQIWTVDGRSIYASRRHAALPSRALLGFADVDAGDEVWRTFGVATHDKVIQVAQPMRIREQLATDAALRSVAPLLPIAPLMALVVWWLAARTLSPLRRVAADVRRRDGDSLDPLPTAGLPEEVAPLVQALNALLERVGRSLENQRAFVADAAHELRSPLTALKLQLQLLRRAGDEAARASALEGLGAGIDRAARLVEQLLTLARSEPGAPAGMTERIDLGELTRQALVDAHPLARSRNSELVLEAPAPVMISGERHALHALVRNLVDNALRYSPRRSTVSLQVFTEHDAAVLQVDDAGPGIPAEERERVFDRFFRRAAIGGDGSGLGLAIVRSVAERHGASVALAESPQGGLRVTVRFPAAPSP